MENKSIKNRLYQALGNKSPKHPFLLEDSTNKPASILKPKKMQDPASIPHGKPAPIYKQGKLLLTPTPLPDLKKKPSVVQQQKLSKEAKSMLDEGKNRIRSNLKPHDIFQLYDNFPEMMEDFFYLNRLGHPYDYQIVTYANRNQAQYMTISSQGVTLYHDKEAEFLSRESWVTDQKRYYSLQKICFFKQYKLSKNFRIWKNKMRRHYMREMSGILNENLFLTINYPRLCLLEVKNHTNWLKQNISFFPYDQLEKLKPHQFVECLDEYREKTILSAIKDVTETITCKLQWAVTEQINKFKLQNNIKIEGVSQEKSGAKEGFVYSQEAILKKQYKKVYKLIKLADSMVQEAKIQMITHCLLQLIEKIGEMQMEDKEAWLTCTASIEEDGTVCWAPNCQNLCQLFLSAIKKHVKSLNEQNQKIINNPVFAKYRVADYGESKAEENRNTLKTLVEDSPSYFSLLRKIEEALINEFDSTKTEEEELQKFIDIYIRHKQLSDMSNIYKENNAVELCNMVEQWKKDEKEMGQLSQDKKGQLLLFNYSDFRRNIINLPKQTLASFFALLPSETSSKCQELVTQSKSLLESISIYPTEIYSFASFNRSVKLAGQRLEDIRSSGSQICLMVDLMVKNKLGNLELYHTKKLQVLNSINALKSKVEESQARENESLSKFKRQNEVEILKIKANIKDLQSKFNAIEFNQIHATSKKMKEILGKIKEILPAIKNLETQSIKITQIEIDLSMMNTNFSEVHQLYENALLVHDTWSCRDEWKNMLIELYHKHYCDVDCEELKQKWEWFSDKVNSLMKILPENQILKNLLQELGEVQVLIETIVALRCSTLDEKSWRQISQYLAYELGIDNQEEFPFKDVKNPSYSVKWLLEINIPLYKEKIEFIVRKSEKEKQLVIQLGQCKNYFSNLVFETVQKKNQFYIFSENKEIQNKINNNLDLLYSMLGNQYSQSVQTQAQILIKHYQYTQELMKAALDFTHQWTKHQPYFDPTSGCLKLLTKESKQFANWELQWKKIIKTITSDCVSFYKKVCDQTFGANCSRTTMKQIIKINGAMDQVKKGLEQFLERKRSVFPRYCFISDQKLLEMLANVDQKEPITAHFVPTIYKHIQKINYKEDTKDTLLSIVNKDGEEFELKQVSFKLQSEMEDIFKLAEEQIKKRINFLIKNVFIKYTEEEISRQKMILQNNAQVVLAIDFISWVRLAEETYLCPQPIGDLYDWLSIQHDQIKEVKTLLRSGQTKVNQQKLMKLLCQSIYLKQKTEQFLKDNVNTTSCYEWQRIPKLCLSANNSDIFFKQLNNKLTYCSQFLGNGAVSMIEPSTEKVWLSISQAVMARDVVCLNCHQDPKIETLRELGWMIAQEVQQVNIGDKMNFKMLERFISGGLYTGEWVVFNYPQNQEILSFLATHILNIKKAILQVSFEKTKTNFNCNSSSAFFLSLASTQSCNVERLITPFSHRVVTLFPPNIQNICELLTESKGDSAEIAVKVVRVIEVMKDCFKQCHYEEFSRQFVMKVLEKVIEIAPSYSWLQGMKCKQYYEYVTCQVLDIFLLPKLIQQDIKVYENVKIAMIPEYEKCKTRRPQVHQSELKEKIKEFLSSQPFDQKKNSEYISKIQLFSQSVQSDKLGVILAGKPLSGKTSLINLCAQFQRTQGKDLKLHKIYQNAYTSRQVFENQKNTAIFAQAMNQISCNNWIVMDGSISQHYLELFGRKAEMYLVPNIGVHTQSNSIKFISQTDDISNLSPSIIGTHEIVVIGEGLINSSQMVKKEIVELESKGLFVNLSSEAIELLTSGLSSILTKLENKTLFKSKSINFAYPINNQEITYRCLKLTKAIFKMNWESIRDKEKNAKKMVDRFISWLTYWSLLGVVLVDDEAKLEKLVVELTRNQNSISQDLANCIIYPNCGLDVQVISGLRTQSSLGIPDKGIITNVLKPSFVSDGQVVKNNKFFEEIIISEAHLVRVNYSQSNRFNYLAQLANLTSTASMLIGPQNSGKKSIVELYAKNMRNKSQFYSIRYKNREYLNNQIEKPFRKFNGFDGVVMKSTIASKQLVFCIQDVNLDYNNESTSQLMRMLFNQKGYYSRQAQWMTFSNCSFTLITNQIANSVNNLRLLPRVNLFQTSNNTSEKLNSIYFPYLKNWSVFNGLGGDVDRIFSSENGDTILDAVISLYKFMQDLHKEYKEDSLEKFLLKPRIGDITKVLTYICRTPEASNYNMEYYYELWAHQVVRVFGDRLSTSGQKQEFFKEMKKQALVKFKENFNLDEENMFNFTSLGIENENCYVRVEDPSYLHNYISNLLESDQISVPLKYLFGELMNYLLQIYRVMAVEGGHMLLLSHNKAAATYLIRLASQVSQNYCYSLNRQIISAEKHIEPTLFFKESACFTQDIDNLSEQMTYQIGCLLNCNVYDFQMKSELKEKIKMNLNKKDGPENTVKKETKSYGKHKTELKNQQKEEDIEMLMCQNFMMYSHFVFQSSPLSEKLIPFLKKQSDIVGKLHFSWVDMPEASLVKVSKQILSFDQEIDKLTLEGHSDQDLIEKVRKIYSTRTKDQAYFNDLLSICEIVKGQTVRVGNALEMKIKEIAQGKECWQRVKTSIDERESIMKCIHEELEETNTAVQAKAKECEDISNKVSQMQLIISSEEAGNQALTELKMHRDQIQIQWRMLKEKKERLEPEKKNILKSIKIGNDYLQLFNNTSETFDKAQTSNKTLLSLLQDKLILIWSAISFLSKVPAAKWIEVINSWITLLESDVPSLVEVSEINKMICQLMPQAGFRDELFCPQVELKIKTLLWQLHFYEQTVLYGAIPKVNDPKGLLVSFFDRIAPNPNSQFYLFKTYSHYTKELRSQIQTFCKTKNGLIIFENTEGIEDLELFFIERKMVNYFNKIIVLSSSTEADITLQCQSSQLKYSVEDFVLKTVNPSLHTKRQNLLDQLLKETEKKEQYLELFFRACSNINSETETYGEEVGKYKGYINTNEESINQLKTQIAQKHYLEQPQFSMMNFIVSALEKVWISDKVNFSYLQNIHQTALNILFRSSEEQQALEAKGDELQKIISVNLGFVQGSTIDQQLALSRTWKEKGKILLLHPTQDIVQKLQEKYQMMNLLSLSHSADQSGKKIFYNFIPDIHNCHLPELITKQKAESDGDILNPLILIARKDQIDPILTAKFDVVEVSSPLEEKGNEKGEQQAGCVKGINNIKRYITEMNSDVKHQEVVLDYLLKNMQKRNEPQIIKLIAETTSISSQELARQLIRMDSQDLDGYLKKISEKKDKQDEMKREKAVSVHVKEDLPFHFNISEFLPSKDPLSADIVAQCVEFNRKLKQIKQSMKKVQHEWQVVNCDSNILKMEEIVALNQEYALLKKNLVKTHSISSSHPGNSNNNTKNNFNATSTQGLNFHNILTLPKNMLNSRTLCLLKCRAAKKFKTNLFNINLVWKLCTSSFSFEQNATTSDLCLSVPARLYDSLSVLSGEWQRDDDQNGKVELMLCPFEGSQDAKQALQGVVVPIKLDQKSFGSIEINKSDVNTEKLIGVEQICLELQK